MLHDMTYVGLIAVSAIAAIALAAVIVRGKTPFSRLRSSATHGAVATIHRAEHNLSPTYRMTDHRRPSDRKTGLSESQSPATEEMAGQPIERAKPSRFPPSRDTEGELSFAVDSAEETVVLGISALAVDLYRRLSDADGNLFFSPYSISAALAMTYAGARENTAAQMATTLHFSPDKAEFHRAFALLQAALDAEQGQSEIILRIVNSLWPQKGYALTETFMATMMDAYGAAVTPIDYTNPQAARNMINVWVSQETEKKIEALIPEGVLTSLTTLVLVNAIYFKGDWANQFDPALTTSAPFWVAPDERVDVPMMAQKQAFRCGYIPNGDFEVLELPYTGDMSMIIYLPRSRDGLPLLEEAMNQQLLAKGAQGLKRSQVMVHLPRMKMDWHLELSGALQSLGMTDAFGPLADFSGMDGSQYLSIARVLHGAAIEMNEKGTEASAATAVVMSRSISPTFRADHPFLFQIRHNGTGAVLFLGRVANPLDVDSKAV